MRFWTDPFALLLGEKIEAQGGKLPPKVHTAQDPQPPALQLSLSNAPRCSQQNKPHARHCAPTWDSWTGDLQRSVAVSALTCTMEHSESSGFSS